MHMYAYTYIITNTHTIPHIPHRKVTARGQENLSRVYALSSQVGV